MQAIRNMEPAWEKVNGLKFQLVEYRDAKGELLPCYQLTKTECLYIATKFNDEARAKLVLRCVTRCQARCECQHPTDQSPDGVSASASSAKSNKVHNRFRCALGVPVGSGEQSGRRCNFKR